MLLFCAWRKLINCCKLALRAKAYKELFCAERDTTRFLNFALNNLIFNFV